MVESGVAATEDAVRSAVAGRAKALLRCAVLRGAAGTSENAPAGALQGEVSRREGQMTHLATREVRQLLPV
jgi:hypothetical protein